MNPVEYIELWLWNNVSSFKTDRGIEMEDNYAKAKTHQERAKEFLDYLVEKHVVFR